MKKNKVYVIQEKEKKDIFISSFLEFLLGIVVYAIILLIINAIFKGVYVENFAWALITALFISFFNSTIKPALIYFTLPVTIATMGIFYPFINVIILKLTSLILGGHFKIEGLLIPFLVAIFISILRIVFDKWMVKPIMKRVRK